jgi:hypothetical protein
MATKIILNFFIKFSKFFLLFICLLIIHLSQFFQPTYQL